MEIRSLLLLVTLGFTLLGCEEKKETSQEMEQMVILDDEEEKSWEVFEDKKIADGVEPFPQEMIILESKEIESLDLR